MVKKLLTDVIESPEETRDWVQAQRESGLSVGFIPTMGSYHLGHRRLMEASVRDNDRTVVSLFVNPTQFDSEQKARAYPRDRSRDKQVLNEENVDVVFMPGKRDLYPEGDVTNVLVENNVTDQYEGEIKPSFFSGVARVVTKLLNIVPSDRVYFGGKDLQQLLMIRRMIRDLRFEQSLQIVPVERDERGIAYSSRNYRFDDEDWSLAEDVFDVMKSIKNNRENLSRDELSDYRDRLESMGFEVDYLDVIEYPSYDTTECSNPASVLILAGMIGNVRLKDNLPLHADSIKALDESISGERKEVRPK